MAVPRRTRQRPRDIPMPYEPTFNATAEPGNGSVLAVRRDDSFQGRDTDGYVIQRQGPAAPNAPGVERLWQNTVPVALAALVAVAVVLGRGAESLRAE